MHTYKFAILMKLLCLFADVPVKADNTDISTLEQNKCELEASRYTLLGKVQEDHDLQNCVEDFDMTHRDEFAYSFDLLPDTNQINFRIVAVLMYRAVRVGGQLCMAFSRR